MRDEKSVGADAQGGQPEVARRSPACGERGGAFLDRSEKDPHQFRFIVSAEDSARLADLKPFVRDLLSQMERDLDTKLDWVAVDHFNTGHPHTHIVIRGRDENSGDLVMARDYIAHGVRARAQALLDLIRPDEVAHLITWSAPSSPPSRAFARGRRAPGVHRARLARVGAERPG